MKTIVIELPAMYADHHVTEVRRLLLDVKGVSDVYASSSFHIAEITFDEKKAEEDELKSILDNAGYLGEIPVEVEKTGDKGSGNDDAPFFRTSSSFSQIKKTVSFTQKVPYAGRPLWPCPGMGPVQKDTK